MRIARINELPPEAEVLLQKTIDETPACSETIESIKQDVATGESVLYLISEDEKIYAVMLGNLIEAEKRYFNVYLLGGTQIEKWKDELLAFIKTILAYTDSQLLIITRKGWKKIYPELREIGSVFVL